MVKEIPLTQGKVALVDDDDFERLNQHKWCLCRIGKKHYRYYALRRGYRFGVNGPSILMHREILSPVPGMDVDHIDGDGLNNQKSNILIVTRRQNLQNRHTGLLGICEKTSRYPGVAWIKSKGIWRACIHTGRGGKTKHLGEFDSENEAYAAYKKAVEDLGEQIHPTIQARTADAPAQS